MHDWDTDKIITVGLLLALILLIIGNAVIILFHGDFPHPDLAGNIISGLVGYMGKTFLNRIKETDKNERH